MMSKEMSKEMSTEMARETYKSRRPLKGRSIHGWSIKGRWIKGPCLPPISRGPRRCLPTLQLHTRFSLPHRKITFPIKRFPGLRQCHHPRSLISRWLVSPANTAPQHRLGLFQRISRLTHHSVRFRTTISAIHHATGTQWIQMGAVS